MAFLQNALAGLPTRPVFYIALPVMLLGVGYHLFTTWESCTRHAAMRETLRTAAVSGARDSRPVRLSSVTDFEWDRVEVLVDYEPEGASTDCPFGWDWSREHRERLIAADRLTVIVFLKDGRLVDYVEVSRDEVDFAGIDNPYTPESALFAAAPSPQDPYRLLLTPTR